jgi:putative endonuclease
MVLSLSVVEGRTAVVLGFSSQLAGRIGLGAYLYLLRCADGSYYAGTTRTSLEMRVAQHNDGTFGGHTSTRRPVVLVYHQAFDRIIDAIAAERQVKQWARAKKEALIGGDFPALRLLARGRDRDGSGIVRPSTSVRVR